MVEQRNLRVQLDQLLHLQEAIAIQIVQPRPVLGFQMLSASAHCNLRMPPVSNLFD